MSARRHRGLKETGRLLFIVHAKTFSHSNHLTRLKWNCLRSGSDLEFSVGCNPPPLPRSTTATGTIVFSNDWRSPTDWTFIKFMRFLRKFWSAGLKGFDEQLALFFSLHGDREKKWQYQNSGHPFKTKNYNVSWIHNLEPTFSPWIHLK